MSKPSPSLGAVWRVCGVGQGSTTALYDSLVLWWAFNINMKQCMRPVYMADLLCNQWAWVCVDHTLILSPGPVIGAFPLWPTALRHNKPTRWRQKGSKFQATQQQTALPTYMVCEHITREVGHCHSYNIYLATILMQDISSDFIISIYFNMFGLCQ